MVERDVSARPGDRLDRCEAKGAAITWPIPLDNLLDRLVLLADDAGQRTTRKELAAAILLAAPRKGDNLSRCRLPSCDSCRRVSGRFIGRQCRSVPSQTSRASPSPKFLTVDEATVLSSCLERRVETQVRTANIPARCD